jgi:hypothetical protein
VRGGGTEAGGGVTVQLHSRIEGDGVILRDRAENFPERFIGLRDISADDFDLEIVGPDFTGAE